jgi:hypothetical protein
MLALQTFEVKIMQLQKQYCGRIGKIDSVYSKRSPYPGAVRLSSLLRKGLMPKYCDIRTRFLQDLTKGWNPETLSFADFCFHSRLG